MSSARITSFRTIGATPECELDVLASVYAHVISLREERQQNLQQGKTAALHGGQNDSAERGSPDDHRADDTRVP